MITSIIAFIIAFSLLVLVHEFGHFWVARRAGITVEKFSIGFGPKLFSFRWKETEFCISLLPLGGFVKMRGEAEEEVVDPNDKQAFSNKSVPIRSAVVMAGPVMNLALSFALIPLVFWIGRPEPAFLTAKPVIERILPGSPAEKAGLQVKDKILAFDKKEVATWEEVLQEAAMTSAGERHAMTVQRNKTRISLWLEATTLPENKEVYFGFERFFGLSPNAVVQALDPDGSAAKAGIQRGDKITKIEGIPVQNWDQMVRAIQSFQGNSFHIEIEREGKGLVFELSPKWNEAANRYLIGIQGGETQAPLPYSIRRYSFKEAILVGFKTNWNNLVLTFQVLKKLVTLELSYKSLGGPVRIAYTLAKASASGLPDFLYFTAFLSLQLAVLNCLPIPVLDGGHLLFFLIEAVLRRPLSSKTRLIAQQVGLVLLVTLILFVTWNDVEKLFFH